MRTDDQTFDFDFADIHGHDKAIHDFARALLQTDQTILFCGLPGTGSTMLARRGAQMLSGPFRAPHHTVSQPGLVGYTHPASTPQNPHFIHGEVHLAQGGILFLDEIQKMHPRALRALGATEHDARIVLHAIPFDGNPIFETNLERFERDFGPLIRIDLPVVPYPKMRTSPPGPSTAELIALYA